MLEVLQRAWFALGFIVFVMSWIWLRAQDPGQSAITHLMAALTIMAAFIGFLFLIGK